MSSDKSDPDSGPILVSACLLGVRCRYDGRSSDQPGLAEELQGRRIVAICPEELGGLGTPRPAADLRGGDGQAVLDGAARVVTHEGEDVTAAFVAGAEEAVATALREGANEAVLKQGSPSCGSGSVHLHGALSVGDGVTAAALKRLGITVRSAG